MARLGIWLLVFLHQCIWEVKADIDSSPISGRPDFYKSLHNTWSPFHRRLKRSMDSSKRCGFPIPKTLKPKTDVKASSAPSVVSITSVRLWNRKVRKECSGVLVAPKWVLTTASCLIHERDSLAFVSAEYATMLTLRSSNGYMGHTYNDQYKYHPRAINPTSKSIDIEHNLALLKLNDQIYPRDKWMPACLSDSLSYSVGNNVTTYYWGRKISKKYTEDYVLYQESWEIAHQTDHLWYLIHDYRPQSTFDATMGIGGGLFGFVNGKPVLIGILSHFVNEDTSRYPSHVISVKVRPNMRWIHSTINSG